VARLRALVVALLLLPVLGCEDEPTPDLPDRPSSSAPSPSETESSPAPTPEALTPEETVRAWVEARNQALQDGDTTAAEALSAADCRSCENSLGPIRDVYANGGHYETNGWRVASSEVTRETANSAAIATGLVYEAGTTVPAAGAEPVSYEVERHIAEFRLSRFDGQWLVAFIGYLS
jgi:hypothetical protein